MDLFAAADGNGPDLVARHGAATTGLPAAARLPLERFAVRVHDEGCISINMRQSVLLSFLVSSKHQNIYEWATARATRSSKSRDEILREQLGGFYERRLTFDGFFDAGEELRYGALNIGGAGASHYGSFCSVVKDRSACAFRVAYLSADSLKTYLGPGPAVDGPALERDAAPHQHRGCLAALKHLAEIPTLADAAWPAMLCNDHDYVEAIFHGSLTADDLDCVRMKKDEHDTLYDFAFEDFSAKLGKADKMEIDNFIMILDALDKRGVRLEAV